MVLKENVLLLINNKNTRRELSKVLDCTEQTLIRYIRDNNVMLTTAGALQIIREETGLSDEQILEAMEA